MESLLKYVLENKDKHLNSKYEQGTLIRLLLYA